MGKICVKNLLVRTIIGFKEWERKKKQDVLINFTIKYDSQKAAKSDDINDALDYKIITKTIAEKVENSNFFLLEKLVDYVLNIIMENKNVQFSSVEIDKPHAIRFAESVSFSAERSRE